MDLTALQTWIAGFLIQMLPFLTQPVLSGKDNACSKRTKRERKLSVACSRTSRTVEVKYISCGCASDALKRPGLVLPCNTCNSLSCLLQQRKHFRRRTFCFPLNLNSCVMQMQGCFVTRSTVVKCWGQPRRWRKELLYVRAVHVVIEEIFFANRIFRPLLGVAFVGKCEFLDWEAVFAANIVRCGASSLKSGVIESLFLCVIFQKRVDAHHALDCSHTLTKFWAILSKRQTSWVAPPLTCVLRMWFGCQSPKKKRNDRQTDLRVSFRTL